MNILTTILADVATTPIVEVAEESVKEFDLLVLTMKGGIIMIPLLLLSILAIYVFFERWSAIRKAAKADNTFMARNKDCIY
jgi:biopolymer transport protein ExbB